MEGSAAPRELPLSPAVSALLIANALGGAAAALLWGVPAASGLTPRLAVAWIAIVATVGGAAALPSALRRVAGFDVSLGEALVVVGAGQLTGLILGAAVATAAGYGAAFAGGGLSFASSLLGLYAAVELLKRLARPVVTPVGLEEVYERWLRTVAETRDERRPAPDDYVGIVRDARATAERLARGANQSELDELQLLAGRIDDLVPPDERARPAQRRLVAALLRLEDGLDPAGGDQGTALDEIRTAVREIERL